MTATSAEGDSFWKSSSTKDVLFAPQIEVIIVMMNYLVTVSFLFHWGWPLD